jgi:hypothetical protein
MIVPPHLETTSVHMVAGKRYPRPERRPRPHLVPAIVTAACVCAGFALVSTTVPRPATPWHVARTFVEARFEQDWGAVWALSCSDGRPADESAFADRMSTLDAGFDRPAAVVMVVDDVSSDEEPAAPSFTVALTVRALRADGEPTWTDRVLLPVVAEGGEFRVCLGPGWTP